MASTRWCSRIPSYNVGAGEVEHDSRNRYVRLCVRAGMVELLWTSEQSGSITKNGPSVLSEARKEDGRTLPRLSRELAETRN